MTDVPLAVIRPITTADDDAVASLIRTVMPEFGATGPGYAILDPEVDRMSGSYLAEARSAYFVALLDGRLVGGGGIAPLTGAGRDVCVLKKMYALPAARGRGIGQMILDRAIVAARAFEYRCCYLETLFRMHAARRLYERNGFRRIPHPLGNTGHHRSEVFYARDV